MNRSCVPRPARRDRAGDRLIDGGGEALPAGGLVAELFASLGGESVELGAAVVFGDAPLGLDPAFAGHAVEGGIEGAFFDAEDVVGGALDPAGDAAAGHRAPGEGFEDEQ